MVERKIVAIGGGDIRKRATKEIDAEIIKLSGKKNPRLLFIPTASSDDRLYWESIQSYFGAYWGCKTDVLFLIKQAPSFNEIKEKILSADIVYVGGGNTLKMMRRWRYLGVDKLLIQAYNKGIVMCGVSAGSICWFDYGHSDSMSSYNPDAWTYIRVRGLGLIKGTHCPHYDSSTLDIPREKNFQDMIKKKGGMGIAIDDNCAIEFINGTIFRVITSKPGQAAYAVYKDRGIVVNKKILQSETFLSIQKIYDRN